MERKLVKQGRNALTVTLPAKWLQSRNLKPGNGIFITERNNDLILTTHVAAPKSSIAIDATDAERSMIWHRIHGRYIEGYDTIIINHNASKIIQEISMSLIGMVVEEHTSTRTVLKSIVAVPENTFEGLLRRASYQLLQLAQTLEKITQGKATHEDVDSQERLLDDNLLYCMRYLNKYENREHAYKYFLICATIEEAGDKIKAIARNIGKDKRLAKIIANGVEQYTKLLFTKDLKKMYTALRAFRSEIPKKTFVDGLAYALAETLYNYLGYIIE